MRIIATSDTHAPPGYSYVRGQVLKTRTKPIKVPDGDVFIHAGDAMRTGYPDEWYDLLSWLHSLKHPTKLFVPGNHDFHLQVYPGPALQELREVGVTVVGLPGNDRFSTYKLPNDWNLIGIPYVVLRDESTRWAFTSSEQKIAEHLRTKHDSYDIVVTHAPVYDILDNAHGAPTGVRAYLEWFHALAEKPKVWINGHIHEGYGQLDYFGCKFYNVAMCDRSYEQVNPPIIIDV